MLVPGFVSHVEVAWEQPALARFLSRLVLFSRLILFDKRGTGMSDPVANPPSMDERMDDIGAVMDAVGSRRVAISASPRPARSACCSRRRTRRGHKR